MQIYTPLLHSVLSAELDAHHKAVDDLQDLLAAERSKHTGEARKLNASIEENGRYTKQLEDRVKVCTVMSHVPLSLAG